MRAFRPGAQVGWCILGSRQEVNGVQANRREKNGQYVLR